MKYGWRLVYHKLVPKEVAEQELREIRKQFCSANSYKCRQESGAFFRRGKLGLVVSNNQYCIRRLSTTRRIFGIIPIDMLERKDGLPIDLNQCMCAIHRGGQLVKFKVGNFNESDFITYYEAGVIKG